MPLRYPPEFCQRAVRLVEGALPDHATEFEAIKTVAFRLGVSPGAVRHWCRREEINAGLRPGVSSDERAEIKRLKRANAELRRANEILKAASSFVAAEFDRPTMRWSDSLTCSRIVSGSSRSVSRSLARNVGSAPARGYRAAKTRPVCPRRLRDQLLMSELVRIHKANYSVYGARKMHTAMRRAGWEIGRDQIALLMRKASLRGAIRGRKPITTTPASKAAGHFPDLVK